MSFSNSGRWRAVSGSTPLTDVDLEQGVVLLVVLGLAHLAGDLVAAAQAEAADLAERHVDVVVALHEALGAQKAEAVGQHVEDAGLVDRRRFGTPLARFALGGSPPSPPPRAASAAAAAAAIAAAAIAAAPLPVALLLLCLATLLVALVGLRRDRRLGGGRAAAASRPPAAPSRRRGLGRALGGACRRRRVGGLLPRRRSAVAVSAAGRAAAARRRLAARRGACRPLPWRGVGRLVPGGGRAARVAAGLGGRRWRRPRSPAGSRSQTHFLSILRWSSWLSHVRGSRPRQSRRTGAGRATMRCPNAGSFLSVRIVLLARPSDGAAWWDGSDIGTAERGLSNVAPRRGC